MTTRHSRGPRRSRPRTNVAPVDVANIDISAVERSGAERSAGDRTGIYDPAVDGDGSGVAAGEVASLVRPGHWVRVTCPACGVVRVRADRVVVRNCVDDETWSYRARCSECDTTFLGFTPATLALPAIAAGLVVETWTLPIPSPRYSGSALHAVDALELHLAMLEPDWFDQLARVEPLGDR